MRIVTTVDNMRRSDAAAIAAGTPGCELMRRAAEGVYEQAEWISPVAVICGKGNNAGDGYALAQILDRNGFDVTVFRLFDEVSSDGAFYLEGCLKQGIEVRMYDESDDLMQYRSFADCILGTGFSGNVASPLKEFFARLNSCPGYKVSVDINSGLSGDTGLGSDYLYSDLTVSVGSFKIGHFAGNGPAAAGCLRNVDIGIALIDEPYGILDVDERREICDASSGISPFGDGYTVRIGNEVFFHHDVGMLHKLTLLLS